METLLEDDATRAVIEDLLEERLSAAMHSLALEDRGWSAITGGHAEEGGISLDELKETSQRAREMAAGSSIIKRAVTLRHSYVWSKPLEIPGVEDTAGKRRTGRPSRLNAFVRDPQNQAAMFGAAAKYNMESSLATDGGFLMLGNNSTKTLHPFPVYEVEGVYTNPNFGGEIWAYKRAWRTMETGGTLKTEARWYYTDKFKGTKAKSIGDVPVDNDFTVLDMWVNRQVGWPLGLPDVLPALPWARMYTELLHNGKVMTDALASFAAKVKVKSKSGSNNAQLKMGKAKAGGSVTYAEGNEVDVFSSAGRTYNFDGVRPVAAMVAAALEVSLVHLLSDPGAAGSSYGSASNLDLPTKRAMTARQNAWSDFFERVIFWGSSEQVNISFPPLEEPDLYRSVQATAMGWQTGLMHPAEARDALFMAMGRTPVEQGPPSDVLVPNTVSAEDNPGGDRDVATTPQASTPDQGRRSGAGRADSQLKHDQDIPTE